MNDTWCTEISSLSQQLLCTSSFSLELYSTKWLSPLRARSFSTQVRKTSRTTTCKLSRTSTKSSPGMDSCILAWNLELNPNKSMMSVSREAYVRDYLLQLADKVYQLSSKETVQCKELGHTSTGKPLFISRRSYCWCWSLLWTIWMRESNFA